MIRHADGFEVLQKALKQVIPVKTGIHFDKLQISIDKTQIIIKSQKVISKGFFFLSIGIWYFEIICCLDIDYWYL